MYENKSKRNKYNRNNNTLVYDTSNIGGNMQIKRILQLIADIEWEYDRMSKSGKATYDELCNLLNIKHLRPSSVHN